MGNVDVTGTIEGDHFSEVMFYTGFELRNKVADKLTTNKKAPIPVKGKEMTAIERGFAELESQ